MIYLFIVDINIYYYLIFISQYVIFLVKSLANSQAKNPAPFAGNALNRHGANPFNNPLYPLYLINSV